MPLEHLMRTLVHLVYRSTGNLIDIAMKVDTKPSSFPNLRDCAYTDGYTIYVSPKLSDLPTENQIAVLAHEVAHCYLMQVEKVEHTEDDADNLVYKLFGFPIYYDHNDIQTTEKTGRSRPRYLPQ